MTESAMKAGDLYKEGCRLLRTTDEAEFQRGVDYIYHAAKNFAPAQFHMASFYANGVILTRKLDRARHYLDLAIQQRHAYAVYCSALEATRFANQAAQQYASTAFLTAAHMGLQLAWYPAGLRLLNGVGVEADTGAAAFWLHVAAAEDHDLAKELVQRDSTLGHLVDNKAAQRVALAAFERYQPQAVETFAEEAGPFQWDGIHERPYVATGESLFSVEECAHVLHYSKPFLKRSSTVNKVSGETFQSAVRTSHDWCPSALQRDFAYYLLDQRMADAVDEPIFKGEGLSVIRYQHGEQYKPHFDFFNAEGDQDWVLPEVGGQRVKTLFVYLTTVAEGGGTHFPKLDLTIAPKQGRAVLFENCTDGQPDKKSLHAGLPVKRGQKWIITKWFREFAIPSYKEIPQAGITDQ